MVEQAISWCVSILMLVGLSYMFYLNIVHIVSKHKCRKKRYSKPLNACHESGCKWAGYCENYEHVYTAEEIENLEKLIQLISEKVK